jgi:hypothetical protein
MLPRALRRRQAEISEMPGRRGDWQNLPKASQPLPEHIPPTPIRTLALRTKKKTDLCADSAQVQNGLVPRVFQHRGAAVTPVANYQDVLERNPQLFRLWAFPRNIGSASAS